jgi:hypothetical protein
MPLTFLEFEDFDYIQKKLYKIFDYFCIIDKYIFMDKGSIMMLHKDPGTDFLSYNAKTNEIFQYLDDPYYLF